jgi:allophanate hydrolase
MSLEESIAEVYRRIEANADNPVFIHVVPKGKALERAKQLEGLPKSLPLWGKPFVVKDNMDVEGIATTAGCPKFSKVAAKTSCAVQRALDAGAILIGKANLDQFATGLVGTRSPYGPCRNAFDPAYISGGSSSGSALAVALGMASFSLGTDTAGSGRIPAAFNGIVGLKPTRGLVSTAGVVPACRSLDCVSVFATSVGDAVQVLDVVAGPDSDDAFSRESDPVDLPTDKFRFGVPAHPEFHGDSGYARLFAQAIVKLRSLGGTPVEVDFKPFMEAQELLYGPWVAERYAALEKHLPDMLAVTRQVIEAAKNFSAADLFKAQHRLLELKQAINLLFKTFDILVVPTAPTVYKISEIEAKPIELNSRLGRYTNFTNLLDLAAIAVPAGLRPDGLPFGITLLGPAFSDRSLAVLGARFNGEKLQFDEPTEVASWVDPKDSMVQVAVVGAHLSGMPLNHQLTERGARLVKVAKTAPAYRLYSLGDKPGMVKDGEGRIELEVWEMPARRFGSFVADIPAPLGIGTVELEDGKLVKGFLCEAYAVKGKEDITKHGGWRAYKAAKK